MVPLPKVPENIVAAHRHSSTSVPKKPVRGRPSELAKQHQEKREKLPEAINLNFEREERVVKNYVQQLKKCPTTSPNTDCKDILKKSCDVVEENKDPKLTKAIVNYHKRIHGKEATETWEEICHPQAGGKKKNRTIKQYNQYFGGMPYIIKEVTEKKKKGYKVCKKDNPEKCFSKSPLPKERAEKQRTAIIISEHSRYPVAAKASTPAPKKRSSEFTGSFRPCFHQKLALPERLMGVVFGVLWLPMGVPPHVF